MHPVYTGLSPTHVLALFRLNVDLGRLQNWSCHVILDEHARAFVVQPIMLYVDGHVEDDLSFTST